MATGVHSAYKYPTYYPVGNAVMEKDSCLSRYICKRLYPLSHSEEEQTQLKKEEALCKGYWMNQTPYTRVYIGHAGVKSLFHPPIRHTCFVYPDLTKKCIVQFSVVESHQEKEGTPYVNLSYLGGILTTASSIVASLHPYFLSYHIRHEKEKELPVIPAHVEESDDFPINFSFESSGEVAGIKEKLPGLRIISWSVNDVFTEAGRQYLPSFQEAGAITHYVHQYLQRIYGKVSWHGHSLGGAFVAEALTHFSKATQSQKPPAIYLDRTFTSLDAANYNDLGAWGPLLSRPISSIASYFNTKCDVVACVNQFCNEEQNTSKLMLISVIRDHRFHGWANLCYNETLRNLATQGRLTLQGFDPPDQILTHPNSGHSEAVDHLLYEHCSIGMGPNRLKKDENLADKLLDLLLERKERKSR